MLVWTAPPADALPARSDPIAVVEVDGDVIRFAPVVLAARWELQVTGGSGTVWQQERDADRTAELAIPIRGAGALSPGHYTYALYARRNVGFDGVNNVVFSDTTLGLVENNLTPVLDEANLFGRLIGAIQELDAEVRAQGATIAMLTERIGALEAALSRIEEAHQ